MPKSFRELDVWQAAMGLAKIVYGLTDSFPRRELFGLVAQMRAAAVSIPVNIAEDQGRNTRAEYRQFVGIAVGSANELVTLGELAQELGYGQERPWEAFWVELDRVRRMRLRLRRSLGPVARADPAARAVNRQP